MAPLRHFRAVGMRTASRFGRARFLLVTSVARGDRRAEPAPIDMRVSDFHLRKLGEQAGIALLRAALLLAVAFALMDSIRT